jgi:hypothetical protein
MRTGPAACAEFGSQSPFLRLRHATKRPARGFMEARSTGNAVSPLALSDKYKRVVKARSCGAAPPAAA